MKSLQSHDRVEARFAIFQEIMARQITSDPHRAMAQAILLAEDLLSPLLSRASPGVDISDKARAKKPHREVPVLRLRQDEARP